MKFHYPLKFPPTAPNHLATANNYSTTITLKKEDKAPYLLSSLLAGSNPFGSQVHLDGPNLLSLPLPRISFLRLTVAPRRPFSNLPFTPPPSTSCSLPTPARSYVTLLPRFRRRSQEVIPLSRQQDADVSRTGKRRRNPTV